MKFCPECGSQLPIGTAKFCPNCGNNLWAATSSSETGIITVESKKEKKDNISYRNSFEKFGGKEQQEEEQQQIKGEFQNQTTHSLGIKLEETVVQILDNRGYSTEMRRKLVGSSGAIHEIDVLARQQQQQNKVLAVECKNYSEARVVGIKEVRDFQSKIQDLPQITDAMFVTNTKFSSEADTYANHNHITLYDGEKLKSDFYLMSIGRLESVPDIVLDCALPLEISYNEATRLDLVNPNAARIARATLVLRPFYVFDYIIEETKKGFLRRGYRPREEGMHIIDTLNGEILYKSANVQSNSQSSYSLLSKSRIHHKDSEEVLNNIEKNQIIKDLQTIKPQFEYKIHTFYTTVLGCSIQSC